MRWTAVASLAILATACAAPAKPPPAPSGPAAGNAAVAATLATLRPRMQHYTFAHKALPQIFFANPARMLESLAAPGAEERLRRLWRDVGERVEGGAVIDPAPIRLAAVTVGARRGFIVDLPPPVAGPEAYAVMLLDGVPGQPERYFTAERLFQLPDLPERLPDETAIIGEWFADGQRRAHDRQLPPSDPGFIEAVRQLLDRPG